MERIEAKQCIGEQGVRFFAFVENPTFEHRSSSSLREGFCRMSKTNFRSSCSVKGRREANIPTGTECPRTVLTTSSNTISHIAMGTVPAFPWSPNFLSKRNKISHDIPIVCNGRASKDDMNLQPSLVAVRFPFN
jgi:hypothetical protein